MPTSPCRAAKIPQIFGVRRLAAALDFCARRSPKPKHGIFNRNSHTQNPLVSTATTAYLSAAL